MKHWLTNFLLVTMFAMTSMIAISACEQQDEPVEEAVEEMGDEVDDAM